MNATTPAPKPRSAARLALAALLFAMAAGRWWVLIEDLEFLALAWWIRARTVPAAAPCSSSAGELDRARVS